MVPSQAQKHVTHNEALQILDALVQLTAIYFSKSAPPSGVQEAAIYIIAEAATGVWAGHYYDIAIYRSLTWHFFTSCLGFVAQID